MGTGPRSLTQNWLGFHDVVNLEMHRNNDPNTNLKIVNPFSQSSLVQVANKFLNICQNKSEDCVFHFILLKDWLLFSYR